MHDEKGEEVAWGVPLSRTAEFLGDSEYAARKSEGGPRRYLPVPDADTPLGPKLLAFVVMFLVMSTIYTAVAWGTYLGGKTLASLIVSSEIDQTVMGVIAAVVGSVVGFAALYEFSRD